MQLAPSEEQEEFRRSVRGLLERHAPERDLVARVDAGGPADPELWAAMAAQLGLQGLSIPEEHGGSGFGAVDEALVLEETGRLLVDTPHVATSVLAAPALLAAGDAAICGELLPRIAAGELRAALAFADAPAAEPVRASGGPDGWSLAGAKTRVLDGCAADVLVVSAADEDGGSLYLVERDAPGLRVAPLAMLDLTRQVAGVTLGAVPARRIGAGGAAADVLDAVLRRAGTLLAAEQVGGAQRCLEIAVAHAGERQQFGRPIGSFQAVKHRCADILCAVEAARSAAWYAAWAEDALEDPAPSAAVARVVCSEAYVAAARGCVQVLGGIGFTWEHPAQLHLKRATSSAQFLGGVDAALDRLADAMLDEPIVEQPIVEVVR